jgi:hypothetical protein
MKNKEIKKDNRGGFRKGSGKKPRYNVDTTRVNLTIPYPVESQVREMARFISKKYER